MEGLLKSPFQDRASWAALFALIAAIESMQPIGDVGDEPVEQYMYHANALTLLHDPRWSDIKLPPATENRISFVAPRWLADLKSHYDRLQKLK